VKTRQDTYMVFCLFFAIICTFFKCFKAVEIINLLHFKTLSMKKHPLTPEGIEHFQQQLYNSDDFRVREEAVALADDPLGWIAWHFELSVDQLELLRSINQSFMLVLGFSLAAALLARKAFRLIYSSPIAGTPCNNIQLSVDIVISSQYNGHTGAMENNTEAMVITFNR